MKAKRNAKGIVRVHNPKFPLAITKGTNKVAAIKSNPKRRKKSRRRNSSTTAVAKRNSATPAKRNSAAKRSGASFAGRTANPKRRSRKATRGKRNPFKSAMGKLSLGDIGVADLIGVAGGAMTAQLLSNAIRIGAPGSWLSIGAQLGIAWGVSKVAPRSIRKAATAGALAAPSVAIVNKVFPNLQAQIASYLPSFNLGGGQAAAGVAGLVDVPPGMFNQYGMAGLVDVQQGSPAYY